MNTSSAELQDLKDTIRFHGPVTPAETMRVIDQYFAVVDFSLLKDEWANRMNDIERYGLCKTMMKDVDPIDMKILHLPDSLFLSVSLRPKTDEALVLWAREIRKEYVHVANVRCRTLEDAFSASNSIDYHWFGSDLVTPFVNHPPRSTSFGDLIEFEGKAYVITPLGFKRI